MPELNVMVGADPEFFFKEARRNVSGHDLVPGTKEEPYKLTKGALQADGTAGEFNIDPASTAQEFTDNINTTLTEIREMVDDKYKFNFKPTVTYDRAYFRGLPDECKILGCMPDVSARTNTLKVPPKPVGTMRTAGGHIHIGWTKDADVEDDGHIFDATQVVLFLEDFMFPFMKPFEPENKRNKMYGDGAAMRVKPYGVEWRSPSNFWLNYPELWSWMFEFIQASMKAMQVGRIIRTYDVFQYYDGWDYKNLNMHTQKDRETAIRNLTLRSNVQFPKFPDIKVK